MSDDLLVRTVLARKESGIVYVQQRANEPQDVPIMPSSAVPMDIDSDGKNSAPPSPPKKRLLIVWYRDDNGNRVKVSSCVSIMHVLIFTYS